MNRSGLELLLNLGHQTTIPTQGDEMTTESKKLKTQARTGGMCLKGAGMRRAGIAACRHDAAMIYLPRLHAVLAAKRWYRSTTNDPKPLYCPGCHTWEPSTRQEVCEAERDLDTGGIYATGYNTVCAECGGCPFERGWWDRLVVRRVKILCAKGA